jgi:predicted component of type VI protein secretion system
MLLIECPWCGPREEPSEGAQFIGFAVDLRNPNRDLWRAIHPVSDLKGERVTLEVLSDRLDVRF